MPKPSCLTIIMDCMQNQAKTEQLLQQVQSMFDKREYIYLCRKQETWDFAFTAQDPDGKNIIITDAETFRSCIATHMQTVVRQFNVHFFLDVKDLGSVFFHKIFSFCQEAKALIGGLQTKISFYYHVCKDDQDGSENLYNFDSILRENQDNQIGTIFLLDRLWTTPSLAPWLSATVRLIHALAQDENDPSLRQFGIREGITLKGEIRRLLEGRDGIEPALFANCRMTRLDDEDVQEKQNRVRELEAILNGQRNGFPVQTLQKNYENIMTEETAKYIQRFSLSGNEFPIPNNTFGCCLKRKKYEPNLEKLNTTLKETIRLHVRETVLAKDPSLDADLAARLKKDIPNDCLGEIRYHLRQITANQELGTESEFNYQTNLTYCRKQEQLREQINKQINNAKSSNRLKSAIVAQINKRLLDISEGLGDVALTPEERAKKEDELNRLLPVLDRDGYYAGITSHDGVQDLQYAINSILGREETYMLISTRVANEYRKAGTIPQVIKNSPIPIKVYDYQDLQDDEFQTLTVRVWDQQTYDRYKEDIFRIPKKMKQQEPEA